MEVKEKIKSLIESCHSNMDYDDVEFICEQIIDITKPEDMEFWQPTMQLRFLQKELRYIDRDITCVKSEEKILQQLYTSNLGNEEWKDVLIQTES